METFNQLKASAWHGHAGQWHMYQHGTKKHHRRFFFTFRFLGMDTLSVFATCFSFVLFDTFYYIIGDAGWASTTGIIEAG